MPVLLAIVFVDLVGFGLVVPLLPFYAERHHASPELVTLLMATYSLFQLFFSPIWGRLSDRRGRRPILIFSLVGSVLSYIWLGLAPSLWMLFAARALAGACAGNIAAAQAYIADVTPPENRARGMGLIGAAFGVGFIVGPALGGTLAGHDPTHPALGLPAFAAAALSGAALVGAVLFLKESLPPGQRAAARRTGRLAALANAWALQPLRLLILLYFVLIFAFAGMETTFAMWASRQFGWGPAQVGYLFAYVGILLALMQGGLIGRLARRFGEERLLVAGLVAIFLGLAGLPASSTLALLLVACSLLALGMGMTQPSINSLVSHRAGAHEQGEILGVTQSVGSLARILGPAFAGLLFGGVGRNAPYFAGAALVAIAVALAVRLPRRGPAAAPAASSS